MNDAPTDPGVPVRDDSESPDASRRALQRAFMERARASAERDQQMPPRRTLQHVIALAAALAVVGTIVFGFDAFLSGFQRVMRILDEDATRQQTEQALPRPEEPMPAYVVPAD
jgi:hypothetical protein